MAILDLREYNRYPNVFLLDNPNGLFLGKPGLHNLSFEVELKDPDHVEDMFTPVTQDDYQKTFTCSCIYFGPGAPSSGRRFSRVVIKLETIAHHRKSLTTIETYNPAHCGCFPGDPLTEVNKLQLEIWAGRRFRQSS